MTEAAEILFEARGRIGFVTLNRPQALNALNLAMIRAMNGQLAAWAGDPAIYAVVVTGAGDRAFCSGGDVKSVALDAKDAVEKGLPSQLAADFFREEYTLNHRIHSYPKPYIALINGIVMGGGKGISAHGSHRVVTENTLFAMPETSIGFFPDVGGGYFLPRCPGQTGLYLALTSKRIRAIDTIYIGFATHFVPAANIPALVSGLVNIAWDNRKKPGGQITETIDRYCAEPPGNSEIAPHRSRIDEYFGGSTIAAIVEALQKDKSDFAGDTLTALYGMSPTSLNIALRQIREGAHLGFADVMTMEYRLSQHVIRLPDFYEGIRAALIDKDRKPKWNPPRLPEVKEEIVAHCFDSLGDKDLILPGK